MEGVFLICQPSWEIPGLWQRHSELRRRRRRRANNLSAILLTSLKIKSQRVQAPGEQHGMGQVSPKPPHFCLVACYPPTKSRSPGPRGGRRCGGSSLSPPHPGLSTSQRGAGQGGTSSASHHSGPPDSREIRQRRRGKECAPLPRGNTSPCRQIAPWRREAAEPPGPQNASNPALPSPTSPPAAGIHSTMPRRGAHSIPLPTARPGGHSSSARPPGKPQIVIAFLAFLPQHQQLGGSSGQQSSGPPPRKASR